MGSRRYFDNEYFAREKPDNLLTTSDEGVTINGKVMAKLQSGLEEMLKDINHAAKMSDGHDTSVYSGVAGYALLYLHLYEVFNDDSYLKKAESFITPALKNMRHRRVTFLCGDAGPLALGAAIHHINGEIDKANDCVNDLVAMAASILPISNSVYDELLYGRAGYLYSLLFVRKYLGQSAIPEKTIIDVVDAMIESGKNKAAHKSMTSELAYEWHGSEYIGAAHGYIGILFLLLHTNYERHISAIKSTLQFIHGLQYPSGNFPSSYGSQKDKLVHWCHGAPGGVYLMIKAYSEFKDDIYLKSAEKASDTIWERGLLQKGYGLCHGASGNGYGFLAMYKLTKNPKYLYRAASFGLWCCDYKRRHGVRTPDRPFSLFEGIAGTAYYLSDLLQHNRAKFPAFEI